jgi:ribonucleoside-diphosphate reductase alpha chain
MILSPEIDTAVKVPTSIVKRGGAVVPFDPHKIQRAIFRCLARASTLDAEIDGVSEYDDPTALALRDYANAASGNGNSVGWTYTTGGIRAGRTATARAAAVLEREASNLTTRVVAVISARDPQPPTVESVQDAVELVLQSEGRYSDAKHYILYRAEHERRRRERPIPDDVRDRFRASAEFFPSAIQQFQFLDKYSRFNYGLGHRESWIETVDRAVSFLHELVSTNTGRDLGTDVYGRIRQSILTMRALPSMRLLAMAGDAARRDNVTIYNCSYLPIQDPEAWVEALLISMAGCGVGFSVESKYVDNLPRIRPPFKFEPEKGQMLSLPTHVVDDTAEGWGEALRRGLDAWFNGGDVRFDLSGLRPAGSVLRTKGGRSSGPEPLRQLLDFTRSRIRARRGRRLRPIDAHDIMCMVGSAAVAGGVRRTAMISLFDYDDEEMLSSKAGDFEIQNSQRWNANNSAVWPDGGLTQPELIRQMLEMDKSQRGEPGIFSREAAIRMRPDRRAARDAEYGGIPEYGTNPCGEITLRPYEFCNLSISVARDGDTLEALKDKVEVATIIGTIQSLATHFPNLRSEWAENGQRERLLGVDITGQLDCPTVQDMEVLRQLRETAVETNRRTAEALGINRSAAVTCVKPSGNSAQLLQCSSGLHTRWSRYYIRNVRVSATSPLFKVLRDAGAPMDPENGQTVSNAVTWVIHFPVKSPDNATTRSDRSALDQCEYWKRVKLNWTEHNPSVTVTYRPEELLAITNWVWENREIVAGMTFLPQDDAAYAQLPYIEVQKEEYEKAQAAFPVIDFAKVYQHEIDDQTTAAQEFACMAGVCEVP